MAKAKKIKQLNFMMPSRPGLLSEVSNAIAGVKVNIDFICAYEMGKDAHFMLTTDSNAKAKKALGKMGIETTDDDVVAVEAANKMGELQKVAKKIADAGINILYAYATTGTGKASVCVFKTSDNAKAIKAINK